MCLIITSNLIRESSVRLLSKSNMTLLECWKLQRTLYIISFSKSQRQKMGHLPLIDKPKISSCIWVAWIPILYWGKKNCEGFWWTSCWLYEGCVGPVHSERETEYNIENLEVSGNFSKRFGRSQRIKYYLH